MRGEYLFVVFVFVIKEKKKKKLNILAERKGNYSFNNWNLLIKQKVNDDFAIFNEWKQSETNFLIYYILAHI